MGKRTQVLSLIILGWILCGYVFMRTNQPNNSAIPDLCVLIFGNSCDRSFSSLISQNFGFPLASLGLAYFGFIGLFFSINKSLIDRIILVLVAFGTGISVFLSILLYRGGFFCPLCYGVHIINLLLLLALFRNIKPRFSATIKHNNRKSFLRWVFLLLCVIIAGGLSEYFILKLAFDKKYEVNITEVQKAFQNEPKYDIPLNPASPILGSVTAPVQLIVFSSFQCPSCKSFAPMLEHLYKKFGGKISITFKNFPLSNKCNPGLEDDMQPQSCDAALASLAAQDQNLFWKYHDLVFNSNLALDEKALESFAISAGLNIEKWRNDKQSDSTMMKLMADIQIANQLGINATPTVFIDGRKVSNFQESALIFLIEAALKNKEN